MWSAALLVPLSLVLNACGGSSDNSSSNSGTPTQTGTSGGVSRSSSLLKTVSLAGGELKKWVDIPGVDSGGGNVTEIVADTPGGRIFFDTLSTSAATYFDYDYGSDSVSGSYSGFYNLLWNAGGASLGAIVPVRHVSSGDFPSGNYSIALSNAKSSDVAVSIYLVKKNDPDFSKGGITINLFVYTVGGSNPVITSVGDAQAIKNYISNMFQQVGITVSAMNVEFRDDPAAVAQAGGSIADVSAFLESASRGTAGRSDVGINCFMMPQLGGNLLGMDGAIPGPGFLQGTAASGLVAAATSFGYVFPGYTSHESDQMYLSLTLAHEIGHYLGLYHPSERDGSMSDPLSDTPECGPKYDTDHDGLLSGPECRGVNTEYLMFWTDDIGYLTSGNFQTRISPQQGEVMNTHPSVL
jgi:hypothetical protein